MSPSIPELDGLAVVELSRLMLHEAHDPSRLSRLRDRVDAEKTQSNPVIASASGDDFLVLDGAHRVHALKDLGCGLALIQAVQLPERTESWQHLLSGSNLFDPSGMEDVEVSGERDADFLAEIEVHGGEIFSVRPRERDLSSEVALLWKLQSLYPKNSVVARVEPGETAPLSDGEMLVRYRSFSTSELMEMVARDFVLPAGITRFHIPRRILGVRFPLRFLKGTDAASADSELRSLVEARHRENRIRRYDEPVVLFE